MKRKSKAKSTTLWFSIWAAILLTYAVFVKLDLVWFSGVAVALVGIIIAYVGGNKAIDFKHGVEMVDDKKGE